MFEKLLPPFIKVRPHGDKGFYDRTKLKLPLQQNKVSSNPLQFEQDQEVLKTPTDTSTQDPRGFDTAPDLSERLAETSQENTAPIEVSLTLEELFLPSEQKKRLVKWIESKTVTEVGSVKFNKIGEGLEASVYVATFNSDEKVVIKCFKRTLGGTAEQSAQQQAEVLTKLNNEGVRAPVLLLKPYQDGDSFILTEYIEVTSLDKHPVVAGEVDSREVRQLRISIIQQFLEFLKACYEKGIEEKDIKLDNLFLTGQGRLRAIDLGTVITEGNPTNSREVQEIQFVLDLQKMIVQILGVSQPHKLIVEDRLRPQFPVSQQKQSFIDQGLPLSLATVLSEYIPIAEKSYFPGLIQETSDKNPLRVIEKFLKILNESNTRNGFEVYLQMGEENRLATLLETPATGDTPKDREVRLKIVNTLYLQAATIFQERKLPTSPKSSDYYELDTFVKNVFTALTGEDPSSDQQNNYIILNNVRLGDDSDHFGRKYAEFMAAYVWVDSQLNLPLPEKNKIRNEILWMTFQVVGEVYDGTVRSRLYKLSSD